jgi:hypothetical protein
VHPPQLFRGCSHSLRFSLPHSLGPQVAPTKMLLGIWRPGPCTSRIAWLVARARMWHRFVTVMGNCHGWTFTSWITVLSAAPYRIRLLLRVFGVETVVGVRVQDLRPGDARRAVLG